MKKIQFAKDLEEAIKGLTKAPLQLSKLEFVKDDYYLAENNGSSPLLRSIGNAIQKHDKNAACEEIVFDGCSFLNNSISMNTESNQLKKISIQSCTLEEIKIFNDKLENIDIRNNCKKISIEENHWGGGKQTQYVSSINCADSEFSSILLVKIHFKRSLKFKNCTFSSVRITDCLFDDFVLFDNCIFNEAPDFSKTEIKSGLDFRNCTFKDYISPEAEIRYGHLKHLMISINADYNAIIFNACELKARHKTRLKFGFEKIYSFVYLITNNFGRNFFMLPLWLFLTAAIFFKLYLVSGSFSPIDTKPQPIWLGNSPSSHLLALFITIHHFFGPFGLFLSIDSIQPNNLVVKLLSFFHFLLSSYLWFMTLMQIRVRFKLS